MLRLLLIDLSHENADTLKNELYDYGFHTDVYTATYVDGECDKLIGTIQYIAAIIITKSEVSIRSKIKLWKKNGIDIPLVIITKKTDLNARLNILNAGADDVIEEPVETVKIVARLCAIIHRRNVILPVYLQHHDVTLHIESGVVKRSGALVRLTDTEVLILELFMQNKRRVLSRRYLEEKINKQQRDVRSNTINVHVSHLRRKLGREFIETVRGQGYRLQQVCLYKDQSKRT